MAASEGKKTVAHAKIQAWAEKRGGIPSVVKATEDNKKGGILRFDFGKPEAALDKISWPEFFKIFEKHELALLYQEKTASGKLSRFNKFVARKAPKAKKAPPKSAAKTKKNNSVI